MNKKKGHTHNQKHLTLADRTFIEQELVRGSSFKSIADALGKDPTTISKEVKLHRVFFENYRRRFGCHKCKNFRHCREHHICGNQKCKYVCRYCHNMGSHVAKQCHLFQPFKCDQLNKAPYVCNACQDFKNYEFSPLKA